jgi:hypothetical protein
MTEPLQVLLAIPLVMWVCYMTFIPLSKVKRNWFWVGFLYGASYIAAIYLWPKSK